MEQTGLDIVGYWGRAPRRAMPSRHRPAPAATGPLTGERVAIIASPHHAALPAAGGRVMASVGRTTTMLAVTGAQPFSSGVRTTASFLKTEALAADGGILSILTTEKRRDRIAGATSAA